MSTLFEQLEAMTVIVADTGDFNAIQAFRPRDATTNPSLITSAAKMPEYDDVVDGALAWARGEADTTEGIVAKAIDRLAVDFGLRILEVIPGRVSTEVDARLSFDRDGTIAKARELIAMYEAAGASRDRILIKIASTWEGIQAARQLEIEGIHCNLTLLFGLHQAVACAHAKVTLISPFVGRILDWYKADTGRDSYASAEDPGVLSVTEIFHYYKRHGHRTEIMGASFRNLGEITELAGCDLLTIAPKFLEALHNTTGPLPRKLDAAQSAGLGRDAITMDEATFRSMHAEDRMASEKLAEGIEGFSAALVNLEEILAARLG
ncbi:MAG: transaldolase [Myxococcota bacterium]